ncbi:MAG: tripartite tricarboxylate transporter substrate binding protein [Burkholderiales bacterium]|nr:tripartite tricarboxylate transporter substrate binding protein [Burkholderiales bacterium]
MHADRRLFLARIASGVLAATGMPLSAQPAFPARPIRIVPFGTAGGPIDTLARAYAEKLAARFGQPVIVDPKPGASGVIAADFVAKAPADGHTIMFTLPLTHINNAILMPKLPYDPVRDFAPLSMLATGGPMMVARAAAPYSSLREFVDFARGRPVLNYGTWGNGSTAHLFCELLKRQASVNLTHVAYKAEAAVHSDLFGEALDFAWANPATARGHIGSGKMKALAIAGTKRVSILPQVPTFAEQGYQGFDIDSWIGAYAPGGTPAAIVDVWVAALREITRMPDIAARLTGFGFEPLGNTPTQFGDIYRADVPRITALIRGAGVTLE